MALLLSASGCGVEKNNDPVRPRVSKGDVKKFCQAEAALNKSFDNRVLRDGRAYSATIKRVRPLFRQYEESAPTNLQDDARTLVEAVERIGRESADLDPKAPGSADKFAALFEELEKTAGPASKRLDAYKKAHCPKR